MTAFKIVLETNYGSESATGEVLRFSWPDLQTAVDDLGHPVAARSVERAARETLARGASVVCLSLIVPDAMIAFDSEYKIEVIGGVHMTHGEHGEELIYDDNAAIMAERVEIQQDYTSGANTAKVRLRHLRHVANTGEAVAFWDGYQIGLVSRYGAVAVSVFLDWRKEATQGEESFIELLWRVVKQIFEWPDRAPDYYQYEPSDVFVDVIDDLMHPIYMDETLRDMLVLARAMHGDELEEYARDWWEWRMEG